MTGNAPRLIVRRKDGDGTKAGDATIVDIPLNNYLLRLRSDLYAEMEDQEFLDRESEWGDGLLPRRKPQLGADSYQDQRLGSKNQRYRAVEP